MAQRRGALAVAQRHRAGEEARFADLQAQSRRIAAVLSAQARASRIRAGLAGGNARGGSLPPPNRSGGLDWPLSGQISSPFGNRFDRVYRVWRLHAGLDIAAPGGTPIRAAASGAVVNAGWAGGYGNYTCLSHGLARGTGLATCYAHQSTILVRVGERVGRGQLIGRVGTTGASTGNHLHFEVRLDGTPVDPMGWL